MSDTGCLNSYTDTVTVIPQASQPAAITAVYPGSNCIGTKYQEFGTTSTPKPGESYTWTTSNGYASVNAVSVTAQTVLVNFNAQGVDTLKVICKVAGIGCQDMKSVLPVTIGSGNADTFSVLYFQNNFYCLDNSQDSYQWGYDVATTLQSHEIAGETNQNYFHPNLSSAELDSMIFWVRTKHNGCTQKQYYNVGALNTHNVYVGDGNDIMVYPCLLYTSPSPRD